MHWYHLSKRSLLVPLIAVTTVAAAGVYANLLIWGGVPVNVHVSDDRLGPDEETKVTFDFQEGTFTDSEVELIFTDDSGKKLWKKAFVDPPLKVWNNTDPMKFTLRTKTTFSFTEEFEVSIMLRIDADDYPTKKARIHIEQ